MTKHTHLDNGHDAESRREHAAAKRSASCSTLRRCLGAAAATTVIGLGISGTTASADSCHGDIVSDVASNWPFAHGDHQDFAPPKGGFALWVDTFGFRNNPGAENQLIRDICHN